MASSLTVSGLLRIDFALTNTQAVGAVADASVVLETLAFANGTGAGQANIYFRKSGSVVANGTDSTTLSSVTLPTQSGTTYTASIDKVRLLYVKNTSATQFIRVLMANTADESVNDWEVHPGGILFWSVGVSTTESSPGGPVIDKVTVLGASNSITATYELVLVGTKT